MKLRYLSLVLLIPIMTAPRPACGQAGNARPANQQAGAFDAVGSYQLSFDMSGHQQTGELTIVKSKEGKLSGSMSVHGQIIPLETVTVDKEKSSFTASAPHGHVTITLTAAGKDKLTGTFGSQEMSGALTAVRRR